MANKKAEILTMDGQVVSPITLATNVLLDDGHTAQDLLDSRDESMFSPTITTSSSISKVGQGDNVDFSENIIDGAYKSCVLKGKTLVNHNAEGNNRNEYACMPSLEGSNLTVNGTVESKVKSAILSGQTLVNQSTTSELTFENAWQGKIIEGNALQSGKKYFVSFDLESDNSELTIQARNGNSFVYHIRKGFTKGKNVLSFILEQDANGLRFQVGSDFNVKISNIIILEYQEGMENWDIPYFTGMQSVKLPVLTTVGKNLFDGEFKVSTYSSGKAYFPNKSMSSASFPYTTSGNSRGIASLVKVKPNTRYSVSISNKPENGVLIGAGYENVDSISSALNAVMNIGSVGNETNTTLSFTTTSNCNYMVIGCFIKYEYEQGGGALTFNEAPNIQIEEGSTTTPYEPYKSNILTVNEPIELRGIGDVKDELNLLTGEVVERIGEMVLDGSENWSRASNSDGTYRFGKTIDDMYNNKLPVSPTNITIKADKLPVITYSDTFPTTNSISAYGNVIVFYIDEIQEISDFKAWLSQNPITVQYPLATESIKTVDLSDNHVYSYKDTTHYTCSSEEGSLLPTLAIEEGVKYEAITKPSTKYSVVFNRTEVASGLTVDLGGATANIVSTTLGKNIVQITTPSTLSHNYVIFKGLGNVIKDVQVIEGEVVGDEPYFEGMCDVENPVVTNCNILDVDSVDYKSNTVTTNEVILRSLPNGVCDTLDLETGEYVQRIGEIVLDNSDSAHVWNLNSDWSMGDVAVFWSNNVVKMTGNSILCDKFPSLHRNELIINNVAIKEAIRYGVTSVQFFIRKSRLETPDVAGFKRWLSQNPVTVQYELATPITITIDLKQHPFAYKDGYVVLTSSGEEISLTPTIEYSLIANRLGQIQSNQKLVEKQQAKIDELESMVVANLVNTQYQQALNEIKLGVK